MEKYAEYNPVKDNVKPEPEHEGHKKYSLKINDNTTVIIYYKNKKELDSKIKKAKENYKHLDKTNYAQFKSK